MSEHEHKLQLTVLVDGIPKKEEYPPHMKVEEIIKSLLSAGEKNDWAKYILSDRTKALDPLLSLEANGVKNGDTLSLTKKDGGGGAYDC